MRRHPVEIQTIDLLWIFLKLVLEMGGSGWNSLVQKVYLI